jgi:hypothetical protein
MFMGEGTEEQRAEAGRNPMQKLLAANSEQRMSLLQGTEARNKFFSTSLEDIKGGRESLFGN